MSGKQLGRLEFSKTSEQKRLEENGIIKRKRYLKGHAQKIERARQAMQTQDENTLIDEKSRYKKIFVCNYLLIICLFILISIGCWDTNSFWLYLVSFVCYGSLLEFYLEQRITEDEEPFLTVADYELTSTVMRICGKTGLAMCIVLYTVMYTFS